MEIFRLNELTNFGKQATQLIVPQGKHLQMGELSDFSRQTT